MVIAMDEIEFDKLGGMLYQLVSCKNCGQNTLVGLFRVSKDGSQRMLDGLIDG
jgi:hypothetical protein